MLLRHIIRAPTFSFRTEGNPVCISVSICCLDTCQGQRQTGKGYFRRGKVSVGKTRQGMVLLQTEDYCSTTMDYLYFLGFTMQGNGIGIHEIPGTGYSQ